MDINPQLLLGEWDYGFALDVYTISSVYIGDKANGDPEFENVYSDIGDCIHRLKYCREILQAEVLANHGVEFLKKTSFYKEINVILPVPPTKERIYQPVFLISAHIAKKMNVSYFENVLKKISIEESKSGGDTHVDILALKTAKSKRNILLIDDVYRTGKTFNACVKVLRQDTQIGKIFVLAMAKTRQK